MFDFPLFSTKIAGNALCHLLSTLLIYMSLANSSTYNNALIKVHLNTAHRSLSMSQNRAMTKILLLCREHLFINAAILVVLLVVSKPSILTCRWLAGTLFNGFIIQLLTHVSIPEVTVKPRLIAIFCDKFPQAQEWTYFSQDQSCGLTCKALSHNYKLLLWNFQPWNNLHT